MAMSNGGYQIKYGIMPNGVYSRNKLLYEIYQKTHGTGVMLMSDWAYRRCDGRVYKWKKSVKLKPIPPVLKIVSKDDEDLTTEAKALFASHQNIKLALQYIGDPDELAKSVEFIESRKI